MTRRWWPTEGSEWSLLSSASNLTTAFHCLRLLCDGLRTATKRRCSEERNARPRRCLRCAAARPRFLLWSPVGDGGGGRPGVAWCQDCAPTGWLE
eukprot:4196195-Alexandrium_andersonii.AAC.1